MQKRLNRSRSIVGSAGLIIGTLLMISCSSNDDAPSTELSALDVQGASDSMYPVFDKGTRHYAVRCNATDVLTITATTADSSAIVSINGGSFARSKSVNEIANLIGDQDIAIDVARGGQSSTYTVHCLAPDFPEIQVIRSDAGVTSDLMLVSPKFRQDGANKSYIVVLDNNGVPRFRKKIDANADDFKRHSNGLYSYALSQGVNQFGVRDFVIVILDENFDEIDRIGTIGLTQTDNHDFKFTDEGNYLFISYNTTTRDMTAFGLSAAELVGDSVIQEVSPDGQVIFEWSSWDHIDLEDCQASGFTRFPSDYAHLNSLDLTPDGDLIASFRGCAQVLKIDRPTGDVIWRLGGSMSDFTVVGDPFSETCGQHTALEPTTDRVLMFDNGIYCLGNRETAFGSFSRVVEYRLDLLAGQAHFVRDHSLNGTYQEFTRAQGSVQLLDNGNWFISWGNGPDMSVTEVDENGIEQFAMKMLMDDAIAVTYRAFRETSLPESKD